MVLINAQLEKQLPEQQTLVEGVTGLVQSQNPEKGVVGFSPRSRVTAEAGVQIQFKVQVSTDSAMVRKVTQ